MLFSSTNTPSGFYVYMYLREDLTPYYVGKGNGVRAWIKHSGEVKPPKNKSHIVITHYNLTELWAFALERWYIRWYGRKDNNTGILRNKTDGGEGATGCTTLKGRPKTAEHKKNISIAKTGKKYPKISEAKLGVPMLSGNEQRSKALTGRKFSPETNKKRQLALLGVPKIKKPCQICGTMAAPVQLLRYHNENCKFIPCENCGEMVSVTKYKTCHGTKCKVPLK